MEHLQILSYIAILITGGAAVTYIALTHSSHRFPFLKPFMFFILFINLKTLIYLFLYYYQTNLTSGTTVFEQSAFLNLAQIHIVFLFFVATFSLIQVARKLDGLLVPIILKIILGVIAAFSILFYLSQLLFTALGASQYWLQNLKIREVFTWLFYGLILFFLVWLMIQSQKEEILSKKKINRSFSVFYLIFFVGLLSTNLAPAIWHIGVILIFKILINLFPLYWIRKYLLKYGRSIPLTLDETILNKTVDEYGITAREKEVLELIIKGKNNKQVASLLCIAPHTVKNHLYRLYNKLGVNSRYELLTFFLNKKPERTISAGSL
ncbi:MAG: helix-turn-helix transcriptional regulator [Candidatus Aminicenantes bacterium]|nr:helix-turn-helix transcriptional regulator [Candidatus Aminicenantes bacterium]